MSHIPCLSHIQVVFGAYFNEPSHCLGSCRHFNAHEKVDLAKNPWMARMATNTTSGISGHTPAELRSLSGKGPLGILPWHVFRCSE